MSRQSVASLLGLLCLQGCYSAKLEPLRPLPLTIRSSTPVLIGTTGVSGAPQTLPCLSLDVNVDVQELRGDTLFFSTLRSNHRNSRDLGSCSVSGPGFIDLAAHPSITATRVMPSRGATALAALTVPFLILGTVVTVTAVVLSLLYR
jgi:hypothetical protein